MAIQLDIKPEDIDAMVRDAVLKAGFGKLINDLLAKATNPQETYNNPFKQTIDSFIAGVVRELLTAKYKDEIVATVAAKLSEQLTTEHLGKMADRIVYEVTRAIEKERYS